MECALLGPLAKRQPSVAPLNPKRPSLQKLRAKLARAIAAFLTAQAPKIAAQVNEIRSRTLKADLTAEQQAEVDAILAEISFQGWAALAGDVESVLEEIANNGGLAALKQVHIDVTADPDVMNVVNRDALKYAATRSAAMIGMQRNEAGDLVPNADAEWRIDESTRDMVRTNVEQALADGWSNDKLASAIGEAYAFGRDRASVIARTETQLAANAGALSGYKASGVVDGKQWLTAGDDLVSEDCVENGEAGDNGDGVIGLDETYPSGDDAPPAHPNCRCTIAPYINFEKDR